MNAGTGSSGGGGGRGGRKRRFSGNSYDQINVTPLIDTVFFLLIIFMITAPLLEYSTSVSPPEMNAEKLKPDENTKTVNLSKTGEITLGNSKNALTTVELISQLSSLFASNRNLSVLLRADKDERYGKIIEVMKAIKNAGIKNISLVTEAEQ